MENKSLLWINLLFGVLGIFFWELFAFGKIDAPFLAVACNSIQIMTLWLMDDNKYRIE